MKIGVDLGGSHIALGLINEENEIIEYYEKDFSLKDKENIICVIEEFITHKITMLQNQYDIEHIGIAVPGTVKNGIIVKMVNLGINNYDITSSIKKKLNPNALESKKEIKITVRNDVKCACLAEFYNITRKDSNQKASNIVFLGIGTGIGGAAIYNGALLEGHEFDGFEFGHIVIKENGLPCKCGKCGCFERYGSILQFKNKVKERLEISQDINGDELRKIMEKRRTEFSDIEEIYIKDLAIGISNLINIFEPDVVVLGGGFTHFYYMFEEKLKDVIVNSNLLFNKREDFDIRVAELGNNAGIIGAILQWGRSFLIGDGP